MPAIEVRIPWPDELPRLRRFMPGSFLLDRQPGMFVTVRGRVERIVGAATLSRRDGGAGTRTGWLNVRVDATDQEYAALATALARRALAEAWVAGAERVALGQTMEVDSRLATFWQSLGFQPERTHEVYELPARPLWERLERIHRCLRERNMMPAGAQVLALSPHLLEPVRQFLLRQLAASTSLIATENAGFRADNSVVLLVHGEVQGVLLARRDGALSSTGLRLIAPELRGGLGWANLQLLHGSVGAGVRSGLETCRFELDPLEHADTRQLARMQQARLVGRREFLTVPRPNAIDGT